MHRCLDIEETLSTVLYHLGSEGSQSELARLARVCRRFTDQALNVLWTQDVPLVALLKILPNDLWQIIPEDEQEVAEGWAPATFIVLRPLESTDWTPRFEYYSSKIKHYDQRDEGIYIEPDVYKTFFSYTPFRYLLPNLRSITFAAENKDSTYRHCIPFFVVLLNPNIEGVHFYNFPEFDLINSFDFGVFLFTVTKHCPVIKRLTFFGDCNGENQPAILRTFRALPHLQYLDFREGSITSEIFTEASKLPELQTLHLDFFTDDSNPDDRHHVPRNLVHLKATDSEPFPQLREASFRTPNWGVAGSIAGYCARPLQTLSVWDEGDCPYYDHGPTFTALIGTITRNPHLSWSLRRLHIHGQAEVFKDIDFDEARVVQALDGLFSLQSLEELSVVCCGLEQLTDAWLAKASAFWPNMRNFYMEGFPGKPSTIKFTLAGIVPLVQRWRALENIGLSLIWAVFPVPDGIANRAVTSLTPGSGSYIRINPNLEGVSLFSITNSLLTLFPRLAYIDLDETAHTDQNWETIQQWVVKRVFRPSSDRMAID